MSDEDTAPFLERLPQAFEKRNRLVFEACSTTASNVRLALLELRSIALKVYSRDKKFQFSHSEERLMFLYAWSIVDQIHVFSSLVRNNTDIITVHVSLLKLILISSRNLRNAMDHVPENLKKKGNILTKKVQTPTLLGVITFNKIGNEDYADGMINHLNVVCVFGSTFLNDGRFNFQPAVEAFKTNQSVLPLDHFLLHAFGHVLNLSIAAAVLASVVSGIDTSVKNHWDKIVRPKVEKEGTNVDELSTRRLGGSTVIGLAQFAPVPFDTKVASKT